jgi:predicted GH43/DUF377 family glycosyl hydrolase
MYQIHTERENINVSIFNTAIHIHSGALHVVIRCDYNIFYNAFKNVMIAIDEYGRTT